MRFSYSKKNLSGPQARLQRLLEVLPGLTSWTILTAMVLLSIFFPFTAAIITISFYLCWLLRLLYMTLFLILSTIRLNIEDTTDWMGRAHGIDHAVDYLKILNARHGLLTFKQRFSIWLHRRELHKLLWSSPWKNARRKK